MSVGDFTIERQQDVRSRAYRWFWSVKTNDVDEPNVDRQEFPAAICSWASTFPVALWRAWRTSLRERSQA
jgi:hypothetical protein